MDVAEQSPSLLAILFAASVAAVGVWMIFPIAMLPVVVGFVADVVLEWRQPVIQSGSAKCGLAAGLLYAVTAGFPALIFMNRLLYLVLAFLMMSAVFLGCWMGRVVMGWRWRRINQSRRLTGVANP